MEAKDTILSERHLKERLGEDIIIGQRAKEALKLQAEISFKAGIREVVEWIDDTDIMVMLSPQKRREWQQKLKEWGIENA